MIKFYLISFILALFWEVEVCIINKRKYELYDIGISLIPLLNTVMGVCLIIGIISYSILHIKNFIKKLLY